ncbi:MAG: tetratricopeptide repeat protein [Spirochaetaceae bacterium]|jgi:tetratricopeptide (TPR) repeat protein|nr:tetratricopeptide repeat protein [Spirochaetaceae bacterium]
MSLAIILIFFAVGIGFLIFFIVKSIAIPKRADQIADMIKRGKSQVAIKASRAILSRDPKNPDAHYFLGKAYLAEHKEDLAFEEFKNLSLSGALGEFIPEEDFRGELAQLFVKNKQLEEALKEYILLIKLAPDRAEYYYWAGKLFTERNRPDMAQNYLRKAAELAPRDPKIHYELGVMLYKNKNTVEAKDALERSLKLKADNAQAYYYLGKLQKDAKDYTGAIASLEKAARDPQFRLRAMLERGGCYMVLNAVDKAIPDLERAVKSITEEGAQESLYARYFLAMCYEKTHNMVQAIEQWDKIHGLKANFKDVEAKLAQYQDLKNDDIIKDFLSAGNQEFMEMCRQMASTALLLQVKTTKNIPEGVEFIAIENNSGKWRNARKQPRLIRIYRSPEMIDDSKVRAILDDAKAQNIVRTMIMTSTGFTGSAISYAESRSIELFNKDKLQGLLKQSFTRTGG